jgi:hypothetical protein
MDQLTRIDKALDEALVNLEAIVLRLSDPAVTRTAQERRALARSVNQFSLCADRSGDPRVQRFESSSRRRSGPNCGWYRARPSGGRGQRRLLHPVDDRRPILFEHALAHEQP